MVDLLAPFSLTPGSIAGWRCVGSNEDIFFHSTVVLGRVTFTDSIVVYGTADAICRHVCNTSSREICNLSWIEVFHTRQARTQLVPYELLLCDCCCCCNCHCYCYCYSGEWYESRPPKEERYRLDGFHVVFVETGE